MKLSGALIVCVWAAMQPAVADDAWFEGRWSWDEDASIESMTGGHPYALACSTDKAMDGASTTRCTTVAERLRKVLEGERTSEWVFVSERATLLDGGAVRSRFTYAAYAIDEGTFELQLNADEMQFTSIVRRTRAGFCMTPFGGDYPTQFDRGPSFVDCYRRSSLSATGHPIAAHVTGQARLEGGAAAG